jgi:hypothetical protein
MQSKTLSMGVDQLDSLLNEKKSLDGSTKGSLDNARMMQKKKLSTQSARESLATSKIT